MYGNEENMNHSVVKVDNLVKRYKELIALDHLSLDIPEGEIFGLLGPNGSGKTTAINCILSLLHYDKGSVEIFGKPMSPDSYDLKRQIGVVMQNVAVCDELTVYENIDSFCGLYISDSAARRQNVEEALSFTGLSDFRTFRPRKLSGGLLRRLNIACGIAHKPRLVIMDEPTVAVDPQSRNHILTGIQKLRDDGATIIYTSHYMEEVEQICTRIAIIDAGKNVALGTSDELKKMIRKSETIRIDMPEPLPEDLSAIRLLPHIYEVTWQNHELTALCSGGNHNLIRVLNYLQEKDLPFGHVSTQMPTLNDVFLEITGKELRDQ